MADSQLAIPDGLGKEIGFSGTLIYNGIISAEEYNRQLVGVWGNRKYEIMRRSDSTIRGALQVVKLPVLSTTWKIDPVQSPDGTITPEAQEKADFCNRELFDRRINWHNTLRQAMTCIDFGHAVFEKTYERTEFNGQFRIGLQSLHSRKQVTIYSWETKEGLPGITQFVGAQQASIIREKLVYFVHDLEGDNWAGTSLLRYVYKDWDIKDKLTLVNAMALEKLGVGVPVVSAKEGVTPAPNDEIEAINALSNMRANQKSYLKVPSTMTVEMLDLKGNTTKEVIPTLNYHDARIMKSILAGFLELGGSSGSGSHALSSDLTSLFMKSEEALANLIVGAINEDLIKQLCDLNYADMSEGYPKLTFGQIADDDVSTYATAMANLTNAGLITPDADVEDHLRGALRLPMMSKEKRASYEEDHKKPDVTPQLIEDPKDPKNTNDPKKNADDRLINASMQRRHVLLGMLAEG